MALNKDICRKCLRVAKRNNGLQTYRYFNSGNTIDTEKMQANAKTLVLSQWKLINHLKSYFAKYSKDKTFENVLNKEFAHFLQKIQPAFYGSELIRYFQMVTASQVTKEVVKSDNKAEEVGISLPNVLSGFKIKIGGKDNREKTKENLPKWKTVKALAVSREAVASRTSQILSCIMLSESEEYRLQRINDLCCHVKNYPAAKHDAVREGGIRMLLRVRNNSKSMSILSALNEALALLGYSDPVPGQGVRILSIDGGGVRGILVIEMLRKLEELSGKSVHEMFDLVCGVSTGAIIASLIGFKQKTLDEIANIYKDISTQVFTQSTFRGTSNLVWSHSYYDTALWEKLLKEELGEDTLIQSRRNLKCPKLCAVSAVVNQSRLSAYIFRNYSLPCRVQSQYMGGSNHKMWEAVRASAAAPTYFEEFKLGNMLHQDGGILVNNPTAVAIHEAKLVWPNTPLQCVISFGTGRTAPHPVDPSTRIETLSGSSWKTKFLTILDSATDTEVISQSYCSRKTRFLRVHTMLSDLLPNHVYFRFNPYLTEMLNMAEIDPNKLEQLKRDALMYLRRNEDKFTDAASALNIEKSRTQKIIDWCTLKKELLTS